MRVVGDPYRTMTLSIPEPHTWHCSTCRAELFQRDQPEVAHVIICIDCYLNQLRSCAPTPEGQ